MNLTSTDSPEKDYDFRVLLTPHFLHNSSPAAGGVVVGATPEASVPCGVEPGSDDAVSGGGTNRVPATLIFSSSVRLATAFSMAESLA